VLRADLARDPKLLEERLAPGTTVPEGTTFPPSASRPAVPTTRAVPPPHKRKGR